jgi:hypothetical protein
MADKAIVELIGKAPFSFVGRIEHLGAATMDIPVDDKTAVVLVDHVLHGPDALIGLAGKRITMQLAADGVPVNVGDSAAFFAQPLAFGASVAVAEVGRLPVEDVKPHIQAAISGTGTPFTAMEQQVATANLCQHAEQADALVLGQVTKLEKAPWDYSAGFSEHDPDWWIATLLIRHVERGNVQPGEVKVLYANSLDVRWKAVPKPKASQSGLWILHKSEGDLTGLAPFQLNDPEDRQSAQSLDVMREWWS